MADDAPPQDSDDHTNAGTKDAMRALADKMGHAPAPDDGHRHTEGTWVEPRFDPDQTQFPASPGDLDADGAAALEHTAVTHPDDVSGVPIIGSPFGIPGTHVPATFGTRGAASPDPGRTPDGGTKHPVDPRRPD